MAYEGDLNHQQWLETVPAEARQHVPAAIQAWDSKADGYNKWFALGWDERDELLLQQAGAIQAH